MENPPLDPKSLLLGLKQPMLAAPTRQRSVSDKSPLLHKSPLDEPSAILDLFASPSVPARKKTLSCSFSETTTCVMCETSSSCPIHRSSEKERFSLSVSLSRAEIIERIDEFIAQSSVGGASQRKVSRSGKEEREGETATTSGERESDGNAQRRSRKTLSLSFSAFKLTSSSSSSKESAAEKKRSLSNATAPPPPVLSPSSASLSPSVSSSPSSSSPASSLSPRYQRILLLVGKLSDYLLLARECLENPSLSPSLSQSSLSSSVSSRATTTQTNTHTSTSTSTSASTNTSISSSRSRTSTMNRSFASQVILVCYYLKQCIADRPSAQLFLVAETDFVAVTHALLQVFLREENKDLEHELVDVFKFLSLTLSPTQPSAHKTHSQLANSSSHGASLAHHIHLTQHVRGVHTSCSSHNRRSNSSQNTQTVHRMCAARCVGVGLCETLIECLTRHTEKPALLLQELTVIERLTRERDDERPSESNDNENEARGREKAREEEDETRRKFVLLGICPLLLRTMLAHTQSHTQSHQTSHTSTQQSSNNGVKHSASSADKERIVTLCLLTLANLSLDATDRHCHGTLTIVRAILLVLLPHNSHTHSSAQAQLLLNAENPTELVEDALSVWMEMLSNLSLHYELDLYSHIEIALLIMNLHAHQHTYTPQILLCLCEEIQTKLTASEHVVSLSSHELCELIIDLLRNCVCRDSDIDSSSNCVCEEEYLEKESVRTALVNQLLQITQYMLRWERNRTALNSLSLPHLLLTLLRSAHTALHMLTVGRSALSVLCALLSEPTSQREFLLQGGCFTLVRYHAQLLALSAAHSTHSPTLVSHRTTTLPENTTDDASQITQTQAQAISTNEMISVMPPEDNTQSNSSNSIFVCKCCEEQEELLCSLLRQLSGDVNDDAHTHVGDVSTTNAVFITAGCDVWVHVCNLFSHFTSESSVLAVLVEDIQHIISSQLISFSPNQAQSIVCLFKLSFYALTRYLAVVSERDELYKLICALCELMLTLLRTQRTEVITAALSRHFVKSMREDLQEIAAQAETNGQFELVEDVGALLHLLRIP